MACLAKGVVGSKRRACIKGAASAVHGMEADMDATEGDMAAWLSQVQAVVAMEGLSDDSSNNGSDNSSDDGSADTWRRRPRTQRSRGGQRYRNSPWWLLLNDENVRDPDSFQGTDFRRTFGVEFAVFESIVTATKSWTKPAPDAASTTRFQCFRYLPLALTVEPYRWS